MKDTPIAVLTQALEECKEIHKDSEDGVHIEVDRLQFRLRLRRPVPPAKLKRNRTLRAAEAYVNAHGTNVKDKVAICWDSGFVKIDKDPVFQAKYDGELICFKPLLDYGMTKDGLLKAIADVGGNLERL